MTITTAGPGNEAPSHPSWAFGLTVLVAVAALAFGREAAAQNQTDTAPDGFVPVPSVFSGGGSHFKIYKNYDAWFGANVSEQVLQAAPFNFVVGVDYIVKPMADLALGVPADTDVIFIPGASDGNSLNQITEQKAPAAQAALSTFVTGGGTLVIVLGDNSGDAYLVPGLLGTADDLTACNGLTIVDPTHPFIIGPDQIPGTGDDLNNNNIDAGQVGSLGVGTCNFCDDLHGSLAGILPAGATVHIVDEGNGNPGFAEYSLGTGTVLLTTRPMEFHCDNPQILINWFFYALSTPTGPGACCLGGSCSDGTAEDCNTLGGLFQGRNTTCTAPEACCFGDNTCQMLDPLCCDDEGGIPQGTGSTCGGMEACCDSVTGACYMADHTCCLGNGDTPQGPGTACSAPEACCFGDDTCQMLDPLCCGDRGGTSRGPGSTCGGLQACCDSVTGACYMADRTCCLANGDTPLGPGTACSTPDGCCFADQSCQILDPLCCDDLGGEFCGNPATELIVNGDFETQDFTGWTQINGGSGGIVINDGTFDPPGPDGPLPPCDGSVCSVTFQSGPGRHTLYQEVTLPSAGSATLSWIDEIRNHASTFSDPNQEFRVEIWDTNNVPLFEVFSTNPGDPLLNVCTPRSFDVSNFLGQTIRVAFTQEDNLFFFNAHLDAVSLIVNGGGGVGEVEACCFPDDTCRLLNSVCCLDLGGAPQGPGSTCGGIEACCDSVTGACYMADRTCCLANGDTPQGPNTTCTAPEACCFGDNTCRMLDPLCCVNQGGTPQGPGFICGGIEACCDSVTGACYMADRTCCLANGDTPQGPGSACTVPEACCFGDNTCQMLDPLCCANQGGTPQGPGFTCGGIEACCDSVTGVCYMADETCCLSNGDTPQGPGTACTAPEACCFSDNSCQLLDPLCCDDLGGEFCEVEACCFPDDSCQTLNPVCCLDLGGTPQGPESTCGDGETELIVNGGFETQDFTGWTLINSGSGGIVINDGTFDPPGPDGPIPPCDGSVCSVTFQSGPGRHTLYQEVTLPSSAGIATLSWIDEIRNHASIFSDPNQEFRVEIWDTNNVPLFEVFSTNPGDPLLNVCTPRSFDVSNFLGQTVRVAFTQEDNLFFFNAHLDAVSLIVNVGIEACCDSLTGACYMANRTCCRANGDTPQGPGTACSAPEACCFGDNTCQMLDRLCCVDQGGTAQGPGSTCGGIEACCDSVTGACYIADRTCCLANGDTPQGPGSACTAPEACCFGDNTCQMLDPLCCMNLGGTPEGPGSTCGGIEACCDSAFGACYMADRTCCLANGDTPLGPGTACGAPEACCFGDNTCQMLNPVCCGNHGGTPQGQDSTCNNTETELIVNGGFETQDFTGWTQINGGSGGIVINDGTFDPPGPDGPLPPCDGSACSVTFQSGPGVHTLYQQVTLPSSAGTATLSWIDQIRNHASTFSDPNQEFRVEIWDTNNVPLFEVFSTNPGDPRLNACTPRSFDVSNFLGQTVRVAFTQQDNLFFFNAHLDAVSLIVGVGIEACCDSVTEECYMADRTCCLANGDTPLGPGTACTAPEACCFGDNTCQMLDPVCCVDQGGTPQGPGSTCGGIEACCDSVTGACYMADRTCCLGNGDTPLGPGTACTAPEACCFGDNTCQMLDPFCCVNQGGTPQGPGSTCGGIEACCDSVTDACYMADRTCCLANGDTPQGPGTACTAPAACCFGDNTCQMLDPHCCANQGGTPQGPGSTCGGIEACCDSVTGACYMADRTCCLANGDIPQGPGTACTAPEACCFGDNTCQMLDLLCCVSQGGTPQGPGSTCGGIEGCCDSVTEACYMADRTCCLANGDIPNGPGSVCTAPAACCLSGTCEVLDPLCCILRGGVPQAPGTICGECGSCCLADKDCLDDIVDATCLAIGGSFNGLSSICLGDSDGDGIDDQCDNCLGVDDAIFGTFLCDSGLLCETDADCPPGETCKKACLGRIPAVSEWGLVVLMLALLVLGKLYYGRRARRA